MNYPQSIVVRVHLWRASNTCAICGPLTTECAGNKWRGRHNTFEGQDQNGARSVIARGMRFVPIALPSEGMKQSKDVDSMAVELARKPEPKSQQNPNLLPSLSQCPIQP